MHDRLTTAILNPQLIHVIVQEANLDHNFITTFCEFLLFRPGAPGEVMLTPTQWRNEKQMVVKYVQVSCTNIAKQQALADSRMLQG